jgi:hypothetical protein
MRLYIGLLVLGLAMLAGGSWGLLNLPPEIEIPEGEPIIGLELHFLMRGVSEKLYLYDDGAVLYVEEKNLREPTSGNPPTRIWKTGNIQEEELNNLIGLFQTEEFTGMEYYYKFSGRPMEPIEGVPSGGFTMGDGRFKFSIDYGDLHKTVWALGYLTPDHGLTYPDMPYPLNEIYKGLRIIIEDKTQEVYRESI